MSFRTQASMEQRNKLCANYLRAVRAILDAALCHRDAASFDVLLGEYYGRKLLSMLPPSVPGRFFTASNEAPADGDAGGAATEAAMLCGVNDMDYNDGYDDLSSYPSLGSGSSCLSLAGVAAIFCNTGCRPAYVNVPPCFGGEAAHIRSRWLLPRLSYNTDALSARASLKACKEHGGDIKIHEVCILETSPFHFI